MCGIDAAIQHIKEDCAGLGWADQVINRLDYHRRQAEGVKPCFIKGVYGKKFDYHTCGNCGRTVQVQDNYCAGCGFLIKWDNPRCLTGKEDA